MSAQYQAWKRRLKDIDASSLLKQSLSALFAATSVWRRASFKKNSALQLNAIGNTLLDLSGSSESEFIALGEKLLSFHLRTTEMSRLSSSVTQLLSSDEVSGASEVFQSIISQIKDLEKNSGRSVQILADVLENLSAMLNHLEGFQKIVMFLRVLCISIRMETARFGQDENGMGILADEVAKMIGDIESRHRQLVDGAESLVNVIRQTTARVRSLESIRNTHAEIIFDHTLSCLRALGDKQARSSALAADTAAHYDDIARSIGEIVTSMQFHDITRQRLEHTAHALLGQSETLLAHSAGNGEDKGADVAGLMRWIPKIRCSEWSNRIAMTGDLCELQAAQLSQATDEFVSAVDNIVENLKNIACSVSEISAKNSDFVSADASDNTCVSDLQSGVSSILSGLREYGAIEREVSGAMDIAGQTLSDLCHYAEGIRAIGARMKLIALNAIVKASQLGDGGGSLGVLAESIHKLSIDSSSCIQSVTQSLDSISTASSTLSSRAVSDNREPCSEIDTIVGALEGPVNALRSADQSAVSILAQLNEQGRALSDDINLSASGIRVHNLFEELSGPMTIQLREMAKSSDSVAGKTRNPLASNELIAIQSSYTMESERLIHESVLNEKQKADEIEAHDPPGETSLPEHSGTPTSPSLLQGENPANGPCLDQQEKTDKDEEDFGDNVELF